MANRTHNALTTTALTVSLALLAGTAQAQRYPIVQPEAAAPYDAAPAPPYSPESPAYSAGGTLADIVSQPVKDIGVKRTEIPPVLAAAELSPYALNDAANFVRTMQARTGLQIGSPEESAWHMGFLSDDDLRARGEALSKSGYGAYLLGLLEDGHR